ncbi:hypothetical protein HWV23_07760 [Natronomonas halophila]|uniref:hypothetical protein n=1 Tax=Natronomonas halophila TaxID=2747817 RepID=UPI0015B4CB9B|nr:hypothetical protein [Natronomonas halophila]QLD85624.1 hypothetical protein HWV23_07760 [Natronomonas halophila]
MADADDRGQLLVIGAVAMALVLVGFGIVLNAVLYTDARAAQERATSGGDTYRFHQSIHDGIGGGVFYANYDDYGSYARLVDRVRTSTRTWTENASAHYAVNAVAIVSRVRDSTNGTQVTQSADRPLTNAGGESDWTVASDVTGVRRFSLNVSRDSLVESAADPTVSDLNSQGVTRIRAEDDDSAAERTVYLYRNSSDYVVVETAHNGTSLGRCSVQAPEAAVDLTEGTVASQNCPSLQFPALAGPYSIEIENGDSATARYSLVVDEERQNLDDDNFTGAGSDCGGTAGPMATRALYSATVNASYLTDKQAYRTNVTVAPETTPRGRTYSVGSGSTVPRELVYTNSSGGLFSISTGGAVTEYPVTDAQAIGPRTADLDGDGACEIPYVNSSNVLKLVDGGGDIDTLAESATKSKTRLAVGTWNGKQGVYYVNSSDGKMYRATPGESPTVVLAADGDTDGIGAVAGIADYNSDGDTDIVFTDGSQLVTYYDDGTTHETSEGVGQNNGVAVGDPKDFNGNGSRRAPIVDGSNNVALLPTSGTSEDLTSSGPAAKSPVAGIDWTGDGDKEVVYIHNGELYYVTLGGTIERINDASGDPVSAEDDRGVA